MTRRFERMSVMEQYVPEYRAGNPRRSSGVPAPHGVSLGTLQMAPIWAEAAKTLGLSPIGVATLWAAQSGDMSWEALTTQPDSNESLFFIHDADVANAEQLAFGAPLPFVVIATRQPLSSTGAAALWSGTAYEPYSAEAVYRQDDTSAVPVIYFLNWGQLSNSQTAKHGSLDAAASAVGGTLLFGIQIPSAGSTTRPFPATPFNSALTTQLALGPAPGPAPSRDAPVPAPEPAPTPATTSSGPSKWWLPVALGAAAGVGAYFWKRGDERRAR